MLPLFYVISHYSNLPFRAWEQRKLEDILDVRSGRDYKHLDSGDIPVYGTGGYMLSVGEALSYEEDAIGIGRKGTIDKPYILNAPFWTVDTLFYTVPKRDSDLNFIHSIFQKINWKSKDESTGVPSLSKTTINAVSVFTPSCSEQKEIGTFFNKLDDTIALHQRKLDTLKQMKKGLLQQMFPKSEEDVPKIRFADFDEEWYQRKLGEEFEKINERNDGSFGKTHWISVAKMYFVEPNKVLSNNIDTRTYVMRKGDIAFEGHSNTDFKFGRFVANDIGPGIVSELFPVYRHKTNYDNNYWKNAIQLEHIMAPIYSKSITSSGNSSNKLDSKHFLNQKIYIADFEEQEKIGSIFKQLDNTIILYQNKLNKFDILKKAYLQTMFI
ncbi:restriction endonuclease subunit S [Listeria monocytogenes]|nr:restriction endonuclease subunit S [Listeria monocytogenes]